MLGPQAFSLHTVAARGENECRASSPLTGDLTVSDMEAVFDTATADMTTYSPFMDYNAMMWTPARTLDSYRDAFDDDGVPTLKLKWPCFADYMTDTSMCYSLIWHIPNSMVVIEIASNETSHEEDFSFEVSTTCI